MRRAYIKRVHGFSPDFIKDIYDTTVRIHKKDGKAYPLRVFKSVSKRWASCFRYKVTLTLNYFEYLGILIKKLEPVEEFKDRMKDIRGLYEIGRRRVYFSPNPTPPSTWIDTVGSVSPVVYEKLRYNELGINIIKKEDYPV